MEYRYDVTQFIWDKETNSFYGDAPHLECIMPDGNIHPEAFPNMKGQFFIDNSKTGGFRRFRFVKETTSEVMDIDNEFNYSVTNWLFESEDGIQCRICIEP
jgi:hypothetical protein